MTTHNPHPDAVTLARWLDGEIRPDSAGAIADHVGTCPLCQSEAQAGQALAEALTEPTPALPPGFVTRTCARATASSVPMAPLWWLALSRPWRAALAAMLLGSAVLGWRLGATFQPQPDPAELLASSLAVPELAAIEGQAPSTVQP